MRIAHPGIIFFVIATIGLLRIVYSPSQFADFDSYVQLTADLSSSDELDSFVLEPLSKLTFVGARHLVGTDEAAVTLVAYANTLVFLIAFSILINSSRFMPLGILAAFSLVAPLLAFVALRASPAYLFVSMASVAITTSDRRAMPAALCVLAALFHLSAVVPGLVLLIVRMMRTPQILMPSPAGPNRNAVAAGVFLSALLVREIALSMVSGQLSEFIDSMPLFARYAVYAAVSDVQASPFHSQYFFGVLVVTCLFIRGTTLPRFRSLATYSLIVFAFLSASPVVAFRYSLYFVVPLLLQHGYFRMAQHHPLHLIFAGIGVLGLFVFGFLQALS